MTVTPAASPQESPIAPAIPRGDLPSVSEIFKEYSHFVWRTLRYMGIPEADLPDACQDVFIVVHRKLPEFEGRSSIRTWLYGVCFRVSHGQRRRAHVKRERVMAEPPESIVPPPQTESLDVKDARATLNRILDQLDEKKRAVFVLYEIEQLSLREISEALELPLQTAYSRLASARKEVTRVAKQISQGDAR